MDKMQVQAIIDAAFPDQPIPDPQILIRDLKQRAPEEEIRRQLAGKNWRALTPEFLSEWWSSFCYLSSEGYRYYLPALLTGALQDFSEESDLLHSVVFGLVPHFWFLYYEGEDRMFLDQNSSFTPDQYHAVCAFLGLVFDQLPRWRHEAAQALHWGWNQIETPALVAANQYYHRLQQYTYPPSNDPEIATLCQEIGEAFADTPYPGDDKLCGSSQGDEGAGYAMDFRGVTWQSAHPELLHLSGAAWSFLSPSGLRYFVPAFLLANLLSNETGFPLGAPVGNLTHYFTDTTENRSHVENRRNSIDWRAYLVSRFAPFSQRERIAIIHYLEFQAKYEYEDEAPEINQALENYWRPSVLTGSSEL